ncbi:MAG: MalT-like region [Verrucomicrobiota bacterium]|jgi:tetratricopeptide (TPR) repeat protein
MSDLPANATLAELLALASERQTADDAPDALAAYARALPLLTRAEHPHDRARVLFQMAQLARFEGQVARAFAHYDELLPLVEELADHRAHGLAVAMRGQLLFLQGDKSAGIQAMIRGLEELRGCRAAEAEHLTCHTRFFSRRLPRAEFERCVHAATADEGLRAVLLQADGC